MLNVGENLIAHERGRKTVSPLNSSNDSWTVSLRKKLSGLPKKLLLFGFAELTLFPDGVRRCSTFVVLTPDKIIKMSLPMIGKSPLRTLRSYGLYQLFFRNGMSRPRAPRSP